MVLPVADKQLLVDAIADATHHLISLLRAVDDSSAVAVGDWTIGDVAAHLAHGFTDMYQRILRGEGSDISESEGLEGISAMTERHLAEHPERDAGMLADRIEGGLNEIVPLLEGLDADRELEWHAGLRLYPATLAAIILGEVLVHGYDVAKASGLHWNIEPDHARLTAAGLLQLLPAYIDPVTAAEVQTVYELDLRGVRFQLIFDRGLLVVGPPGGRRPDCRIRAEPVTFLLVSYGRIAPILPALTGRLLAYGRKPWLGLRLTSLLRSP